MEFVLVELAFVFGNSLEEVLAFALLHAPLEGSLVAQSTPGLEGALLVLVVLELPRELIAVGEDELAIGAVFLPILHGALEARPIDVCYLATCELPAGEDAPEDADCPLVPLAVAMRLGVLVEISLVVVAVLEGEPAVVADALLELPLEDGLV